jgi:hypothetical protein
LPHLVSSVYSFIGTQNGWSSALPTSAQFLSATMFWSSNFNFSKKRSILFSRDEHENEAFRPIRVMNPPKGQSQLVLPLGGGKFKYVERLRYFTYRKMTYIWHPNELKYTTIAALEADVRDSVDQ